MASRPNSSFTIATLMSLLASAVCITSAAEPVSYNRDVRQILSNNCFKCHGPDENTRSAGLRLDTEEGSRADLRSGSRAIVPGDLDASGLIARILSTDPDDRMPPPDSGKVLQPEQIETLKQWVSEGAPYERHWSFVKPEKPQPPALSDPLWSRSGLDDHVLARLDKEGLTPSPEADRPTLTRRLYLDLIGIPPTPAQVKAFVVDESVIAYERVVEELLASPHFGERWAQMWLDVARYADTKGYEADRERTIWPYRDWVIDAFNRDLPFDQFTIEQLAGDLLPHPTLDQRIATAFHRNTMTNDEGGTDDEEFRDAAVVDRVNTTMEAWMGMTMACAQCHTHKYDPISQKEYFEFFAFLNQTADTDKMDEAPTLKTPTPSQQQLLDALDRKLDAAKRQLDHGASSAVEARNAWEAGILKVADTPVEFGPWYKTAPIPGSDYNDLFNKTYRFERSPELDHAYEDGGKFVPVPELKDGEPFELAGEYRAFGFYRTVTTEVARPLTLYLGSNDGLRVHLNGRPVHRFPGERGLAPDSDTVHIDLEPGINHLVFKVVNGGGVSGFYCRADTAAYPEDLVAAVRIPEQNRTPEQQQFILQAFTEAAPKLASQREAIARIEEERKALQEKIPSTPVMAELPPEEQRKTHIQLRGNFLDLGDEVAPGVPDAFHDWDPAWPKDRLGLAKWLISPENPLTARVIVNRFWEKFFGIGLVETSEDFGTQGDLPVNQDLLDWLAVSFMESGWSMKDLCRTIVTSATYRQSSDVTPALQQRAPYNRLLARGPRFRLPAETIRDQALHVAGLLNPELHGPSVMPHQPEGVWQVVYNGTTWQTSDEGDQYRRGLYTFWRRTSPYPSMVAFDAPSREVCEVRRIRTNTPLQALVVLNDPVYIEAAQALARRIMADTESSVAEKIVHAFQRTTGRSPEAKEMFRLSQLYQSEHDHYTKNPEDALAMAADPLGPLPEDCDPAEAAAWTVVANVLLNLDEVLTKT